MFVSWLTVLVPWGHGLMKSKSRSSHGVSSYMLTTLTWSFIWHFCAILIMIYLLQSVLPHKISPRKSLPRVRTKGTIKVPYPRERGPTTECRPTPHFGLNFLLRSSVYSNVRPCVAALESAVQMHEMAGLYFE